MTLRLAIVQRYFAHYRKPVFDHIATAWPNIDLTLFCEMLEAPKPEEGISVPAKSAPYVRSVRTMRIPVGGKALYAQPAALREIVRGGFDVVVLESGAHILTNLMLLRLLRHRATRTVVWTKGWFDNGKFTGLFGRLRLWMLRNADGYICYGCTTRQSLIDLGVPASRVAVAQNTVDVSRLLNASNVEEDGVLPKSQALSEVLASGRRVIFSIGRHGRDKRFGDLLHAFAKLSADFPDLSLVIAGTGPEHDPLRATAEELGIANVCFPGAVSQHDAEVMFRHSLICVFPGAVGLALNEAMAVGAAVVCADEPGPDSELLQHGVSGLRYPPGDIDALTRELRCVVERPGLRQELGAAARGTIESRATVSHMGDAIAEFAIATGGGQVSG